MDFNEAISKINWGRSLLFTGAGFSKGANNLKGEFRTAYEIANDLYSECNVETIHRDGNLQKAAQWYIRNKGVDSMIEYFNEEFTVRSISPEQIEIGKLNWKRCYTINYDNIIEQAYYTNGRLITTVTPSDNSQNYKKSDVCLHINGAISKINRDNINTDIKLTSKSYANDYVKNTGWWQMIEDDFIVCDAIFFIGCSLDHDLDLIRLLNHTNNIKSKTFFIVGPDEHEMNIIELEEFGMPMRIGLKGFIDAVKTIPQTPVPALTTYKYFISPKHLNAKPKWQLNDFTNLLIKGNINENVLYYSIKEPSYYPYFLYRHRIDFVVDSIATGHKYFVVNSDLGNGKTMFMRGLSCVLQNKGYNVFWLERNLETATDEFIRICENEHGNIAIFIESYVNNLSLLKRLKYINNADIVLVVSERTNIYESSFTSLEDISDDYFININIDELDNNEVDKLIELVEKNGLWRTWANKTINEKQKYIIEKCKRHIGQFILLLYQAKHIESEYQSIIDTIKNKQEYYQALIYILFGNILDFKLSYTDIVNDLDIDILSTPNFSHNIHLRELIDFENNRIVFKSSLLAQYITRNMLRPDDVVSALIVIFKQLHKKRDITRIKQYLKALTRYNNLDKLLNKTTGFNRAIFTFYENIVDCEYNRNNPLFWLQYAIARLADADYANSEYCFENAYAFAKLQAFDTYQIDNHYARYLLENAIYRGSQENSMRVFQEAHRKLMTRRRGDEYKYYNYRVANNYLPFYERFYEGFSDNEKREFIRACFEMQNEIKRYLERKDASNKNLVEQTYHSLQQILSD